MVLEPGIGKITSTKTRHFAISSGPYWEVSYLVSRNLRREEALAAMHLADELAQDPAKGSAEMERCIHLAASIGLTVDQAREAVEANLESALQLLTRPRQIEPDFEAGS